jgi:ABC-type sugar transport system ATPase subunit
MSDADPLPEDTSSSSHNGTPLLEVRHLSKVFPGVVALDDVSMSVRPAEVHGLVGENGAGKSTLLKIVSGLYLADGGELLWEGEVARFKAPPDAVKRGIELIPQELSLAPSLTAAENIMMGIYPAHLGRVRWREVKREAQAVAATIHLDADLGRKASTLSPAEQRLVMIARALARKARLVIMDEPSVSLSEVEVDALKAVVHRLREGGVTVIYVSHRLDEVLELTDRVTVMKDGRVISTDDTSAVDKTILIERIIGRSYGEQFPARRVLEPSSPLLSVRDLSGGIVRDVSFDLHPGEILGISGLVGSGRTEIVRMVFGADALEAGEIEVDGRPVKLSHPRHAIRKGLSLLPEDRRGQGAIVDMSIAANVSLPVLRRFAMRGTGLIHERVERRAVRERISRLNLSTPSVQRPLKFLSGGNQQKALVAKWEMSDSRVFMFDEPTAGVDVGAKQEIYSLIAQLGARGAGVILISSELEEVVGLCHRVLVMREGRNVGELAGEAISEAAILQLCYEA